MVAPPTFSPNELQHIVDCSLQHHFWLQTDREPSPADDAITRTIHHLHASGGPRRLNLPATLRFAGAQLPTDVDTATIAEVRAIIAAYHRRLRQNWAQIVAGNEALALNIALPRTTAQIAATIHRIDKMDDGGITAMQFILPNANPPPLHAMDIAATALHALAAAEYPHRRPVQVAYYWLAEDRIETRQLTETAYRENLHRLKARLQLWLDGEILARPGLHCNRCPFKSAGCPLYAADES